MTRQETRRGWARKAVVDAGYEVDRVWETLGDGRWTTAARLRSILGIGRAIRHLERAQRHLLHDDATAQEVER
jgi:hypothetical protein